jgi:hypothetical protein
VEQTATSVQWNRLLLLYSNSRTDCYFCTVEQIATSVTVEQIATSVTVEQIATSVTVEQISTSVTVEQIAKILLDSRTDS